MSQRINAARVVVSVNMKYSDMENTDFTKPRSQGLSQNRMIMKSVSSPESSAEHSTVKPIFTSSDRHMSRRKPANQGLKPLDQFENWPAPLPPVQVESEFMETVPITIFPETKNDYSRANTDFYSTIPESSPISSDAHKPEAESSEKSYVYDRLFYLLSQKYYGTIY